MLVLRSTAAQVARATLAKPACTCTRSIRTSSALLPRIATTSTQRPRRAGLVGGVRGFASSSAVRNDSSILANANIIQPTENDPVSITSLTPTAGFTFSDGLVVPSPILIIDGAVFMWDVGHPFKGGDELGRTWNGWDMERLKVFEALSPRPEILLVGTGTSTAFAPPAFKKYLNNLGIQVDILDSRNAASTYNLLSEEGRRVAAALYPVSELNARTGRVQE